MTNQAVKAAQEAVQKSEEIDIRLVVAFSSTVVSSEDAYLLKFVVYLNLSLLHLGCRI